MKYSCIVTILLVVAYYAAAYFFCPIDPERLYTWYSGIWHGIFWFPNIVMSLFSDSIYGIAPNHTTWYMVFYFISIVGFSFIGQIIRAIVDTLSNGDQEPIK